MNPFDNTVGEWINGLLIKWGLSADVADKLDGFIVLIYLVLLILVINLLFRWGVVRGIEWIIAKTKVSWDNILFEDKVMKRLCAIVTPLVINMMLPMVISSLDIHSKGIASFMQKAVDIAIVITCVRFIGTLFKATFELIEHRPQWHGKPIRGLLQIVQVLLALIATILIICIIFNMSPVGLLTGLGASAAVISFIFKDTLLGLVAGIQLSANNMLKVGDWIEMPSRGIDGVIIEVSLTTIKIRSWGNTMQTIPPYLLVSEPFENWQAMRDSGGRRVKRSLNIDISTVRFATEELIAELRSNKTVSPIFDKIATQSLEGATLTNLDLYMRSVDKYLNTHPRIHKGMIIMVRQLQPTEWGIPIELYFFSSDVNWIPYEHLQTEVISHVVALAPLFGLRLYQAPSTLDLKA